MDIPTSLLAELALLTDVLDSPSADVSLTVSDLMAELTRALPSFVGLSVVIGEPDDAVEITTIEDATHVARIRTSLRFPLHGVDPAERPVAPAAVLIVFAATPGALIDLAADLTWLTGRPLGDARLDEDLAGPRVTSGQGHLAQRSIVDQALGVLMGGGLTQEEASAELDTRAVDSGVERHLAAAEVLASLHGRNL